MKKIITDMNILMGNFSLMSKSIPEIIKRKFFDLEDYFFQKKYSLDLNGIVTIEELDAENKDSLPHATAYQAVWTRNLRELFSEVKKNGCKFDNFIDIGSGKGKACFYAQSTKEFNSIIGIDFSKKLIDVANRNKLIYYSEDTKFLHRDASEFLLPNKPSLVFMFNPFDRIVLEKFIFNNINHFREQKSIIAYANDTGRLSLTENGFKTIFRNPIRRISLFQIP